MRRSARIACAGAFATLLLAAAPARAYKFNEYVEAYGYAQVWLTVFEQMQKEAGLVQHPSGELAADVVSGLSLSRVRAGARLTLPDWDLSLHAQVKFDHDVALLDADVAWTPLAFFGLHVGQFKVPGTCEALTEDRALDFILRSDISTNIADYSLSKAAYTDSLLYGSSSNLRDIGIAVKGEQLGRWLGGRYFLMVGNGLGANMAFGGLTHKEYWVTNKGQFYWGGRVELVVAQVATLGLFGSYNRHDNIVFNSERAVYDINRRAVGGDLQIEVPHTGLRLMALGGGGQIRDDYTGSGKIDLRYSGWAVSAVWNIFPVLEKVLGRSLPWGHAVELVARYDTSTGEMGESGNLVRVHHATFGANYLAGEHLKVQLNYVVRRTEDPVNPQLANDILFANLQAAF